MVGTGYVDIGAELISDGEQTGAVCQAFVVAAVGLVCFRRRISCCPLFEYQGVVSRKYAESCQEVRNCAIND